MARGQSLQDPFLNTLRKERVPVSIYLVNGIKLQGQIDSFDQFVVLLKNSVSQMVYKHAISTVVPARTIRLPASEEDEAAATEADGRQLHRGTPGCLNVRAAANVHYWYASGWDACDGARTSASSRRSLAQRARCRSRRTGGRGPGPIHVCL